MKIYGSTDWSAAFRTVVLSGNTVFWMFLMVPKLLWQWWRNIFTERLRDCADMSMVRLTEPSCRLWGTCCIRVWCCAFVPLHECNLAFWRCYLVPCFFYMSYLVLCCLWLPSWSSWRCSDDNSWKQPLWTNSVDRNGSITWKALTSTCVLWTNLYPNDSRLTCACAAW